MQKSDSSLGGFVTIDGQSFRLVKKLSEQVRSPPHQRFYQESQFFNTMNRVELLHMSEVQAANGCGNLPMNEQRSTDEPILPHAKQINSFEPTSQPIRTIQSPGDGTDLFESELRLGEPLSQTINKEISVSLF